MIVVQMNDERDKTKAVSKSVTMTVEMWDVVDAHATTDPQSGDRSTYIRRLVTADLQAAGKLPGSADAEDLALFMEARRLLGRAPVRAALVALGVQREANASEASAA